MAGRTDTAVEGVNASVSQMSVAAMHKSTVSRSSEQGSATTTPVAASDASLPPEELLSMLLGGAKKVQFDAFRRVPIEW